MGPYRKFRLKSVGLVGGGLGLLASVLVPLELRLPDPPRPVEHPDTSNGAVVDRADGRGWPTSPAARRPTPEEVDRWLRS